MFETIDIGEIREINEIFATFIWSHSRSSTPVVILGKVVLKIRSKFTGEHPCRSVISVKLQNNFIEITLRHGCSLLNLLHIFRVPFPKNTSGRLLLTFWYSSIHLNNAIVEDLNSKIVKFNQFVPRPLKVFLMQGEQSPKSFSRLFWMPWKIL